MKCRLLQSEIRFHPRHVIDQCHEWQRPDELLLLHYKDLSFSYVIERHRALGERLKSLDVQNSWGFHYFFTAEEYALYRQQLSAKLVDVSNSEYRPWRDHTEPRWWRPAPAHEQVSPHSATQRILEALRPRFRR